jgi:hypothetical protein
MRRIWMTRRSPPSMFRPLRGGERSRGLVVPVVSHAVSRGLVLVCVLPMNNCRRSRAESSTSMLGGLGHLIARKTTNKKSVTGHVLMLCRFRDYT